MQQKALATPPMWIGNWNSSVQSIFVTKLTLVGTKRRRHQEEVQQQRKPLPESEFLGKPRSSATHVQPFRLRRGECE